MGVDGAAAQEVGGEGELQVGFGGGEGGEDFNRFGCYLGAVERGGLAEGCGLWGVGLMEGEGGCAPRDRSSRRRRRRCCRLCSLLGWKVVLCEIMGSRGGWR